MEHLPRPRPLPCFGSEFKEEDAMCQSCPHRTGCMEAMGCRLSRIPLSKVRFNLVPEVLQVSSSVYDPNRDAHSLFYSCHAAIFGKPCGYRIPPGGVEKILSAADTATCDVRLFITAVMMAHQEANPTAAFYPNMLFGQSAIKRVNLYRDACRKLYGHFDIGAFEQLRGKKVAEDLEAKMLRSEILFGELIVGHRLRSDAAPFDAIFRLRELGFDPVWLAIEDTYKDVLERHVKAEEPTTGSLATLRHSVFQVKKSLKANRGRLKEVFKLRETILPQAVERVLSYHRLLTTDFEIMDNPVVSAHHFWLVLGKALSNYYCWRALDGDKSAMARISNV